MMMRMLDAGGMPVLVDHLRVANEDNPGGYYEFEPVKQTKRDASWVEQAGGKAVKMVYRLLYDLPTDREYRVLFMRRELTEVLASQKKMLEREQRADGVNDHEMETLFRAELARFDAWIVKQPKFQIMDVRYGELMTDAASAVARIDEFLGGGLNRQAMCDVIDPSLYRNRK